MKRKFWVRGVVFLVLSFCFCCIGVAQKSKYYVTEWWGAGNTFVYQNGAEQDSFSWGTRQSQGPIYVDGEYVWQANVAANRTAGGVYTLAGVETNTRTYLDIPDSSAVDAAFDGTYVYTVAINTGWVWRSPNKNYSSSVALFQASDPSVAWGITYDSATNTLWTCEGGGTSLKQWSLDGNLLQTFDIGHTASTALAYDPADDTLWLLNYSDVNNKEFEQYSKGGVLLDSFPCDCPHGIRGGEILASESEVAIDIKPSGDPNAINCNNDKAVITVAILTNDDFDATSVDHTTVTLAGASEIHLNKKTGEPRRHEEDVDGDGDIDLVIHVRLSDTSLDCASTEATLEGETYDGTPIAGTDLVKMVPGTTVITVN